MRIYISFGEEQQSANTLVQPEFLHRRGKGLLQHEAAGFEEKFVSVPKPFTRYPTAIGCLAYMPHSDGINPQQPGSPLCWAGNYQASESGPVSKRQFFFSSCRS